MTENTGHIYATPQDAKDGGGFIFPRAYPLNIREGSTLNVTWKSSYESVDLYFYQRGKVTKPTQLASKFQQISRGGFIRD